MTAPRVWIRARVDTLREALVMCVRDVFENVTGLRLAKLDTLDREQIHWFDDGRNYEARQPRQAVSRSTREHYPAVAAALDRGDLEELKRLHESGYIERQTALSRTT